MERDSTQFERQSISPTTDEASSRLLSLEAFLRGEVDGWMVANAERMVKEMGITAQESGDRVSAGTVHAPGPIAFQSESEVAAVVSERARSEQPRLFQSIRRSERVLAVLVRIAAIAAVLVGSVLIANHFVVLRVRESPRVVEVSPNAPGAFPSPCGGPELDPGQPFAFRVEVKNVGSIKPENSTPRRPPVITSAAPFRSDALGNAAPLTIYACGLRTGGVFEWKVRASVRTSLTDIVLNEAYCKTKTQFDLMGRRIVTSSAHFRSLECDPEADTFQCLVGQGLRAADAGAPASELDYLYDALGRFTAIRLDAYGGTTACGRDEDLVLSGLGHSFTNEPLFSECSWENLVPLAVTGLTKARTQGASDDVEPPARENAMALTWLSISSGSISGSAGPFMENRGQVAFSFAWEKVWGGGPTFELVRMVPVPAGAALMGVGMFMFLRCRRR